MFSGQCSGVNSCQPKVGQFEGECHRRPAKCDTVFIDVAADIDKLDISSISTYKSGKICLLLKKRLLLYV